MNILKKILQLFLICSVFLCSRCQSYEEICGVPVKGRAWELAADIAVNGDATFIPESVEVMLSKAYIRGWLNTNLTNTPYRKEPYIDGYVPAVIECECEKFQVKHAEICIIL